MFRKTIFTLMFLAVCAVVPALAGTDCKKGTFVGTYTRPTLNVDALGNGTAIHNLAYLLTLNADGTARQYWTGTPDFMLSSGTGTPSIGSWTCRSDGNVVVTMLTALFVPATGIDPGNGNPTLDVGLYRHDRITYLFSITDADTLTRTQARARSYNPGQDPTDPNGGTLGPLSTATIVYKRLTASDADLIAP